MNNQDFVDILKSLQLEFKAKNGRFPSNKENNKLIDKAEFIVRRKNCA